MLKIWGRANSINVQKVLRCCGELGLQYDRIDAGHEFGVTKTPQYRVLNPNGLVPTIEDGDFQLWESNVIVRYLAQKSGHGRLYPADIKTGFDAERWMDWQTTVFWPALRPLFIELIRTPPAKRDATVISRAESLPSGLNAALISACAWPCREAILVLFFQSQRLAHSRIPVIRVWTHNLIQ